LHRCLSVSRHHPDSRKARITLIGWLANKSACP
jgi:hypothetical protein